MPTRQELIRETLKKLGVLAAGQYPEPEDVNTIDESIDGLLTEAGLYVGNYFNADANILDECLDPLATFLANANAPGFGQPQNPLARGDAVNRLRYMRPITYVGQPQQTSYF